MSAGQSNGNQPGASVSVNERALARFDIRAPAALASVATDVAQPAAHRIKALARVMPLVRAVDRHAATAAMTRGAARTLLAATPTLEALRKRNLGEA